MNGKSRRRGSMLVWWTVIAVLLAGFAPAGAIAARPKDDPPLFLSPSTRPYGRSYSKWAAMWWQWALAEPKATNPIIDPNGADCAEGQSGKVWFLAGSPTPVTRNCTVPAGKALFFPVINSAYFAFRDDPPEQRTEEFLRAQVSFVRKGATGLSATIDEARFNKIRRRLYTESTLFRVVLPADNLFGLPEGFVLNPSVDAGFYLMIAPLSPGSHTIHLTGTLPTPSSVDATYHITVRRGRGDG